ncbi:MAG TPA: hypothetical protein VLD67_08615 [Vicinamibacterales bacterium]|nr:hypothetical protein [Vicinamibacterales bacterium]
MKGIRHWALSAAVLIVVLLGLVSVDARVREQFTNLLAAEGSDLAPLGDRFGEFGSALLTAIRLQSIEHAPLLVFATVGAVLFFLMVRT